MANEYHDDVAAAIDSAAATRRIRMTPRVDAYRAMSARLEGMGDGELVALLRRADATEGIGRACVLDIDGARVFAKSIPVTDRELEHPYSTRNLFGLPAFYHYPIGSAGFGVFREVAAHVKATEWVLQGDVDTFPLLYHHRILPLGGETLRMTDDELREYIEYWNGSDEIRTYMLARRAAPAHAVLFLEYVPHVLEDWFGAHLPELDMVTSGMERTIELLRARGVGHFDTHFGNVLTDGRQIFLTDFGMVMDEGFELDDDERAFFAAHRHYDSGRFVQSLYLPLRQLSPAVDLDHLDELVASGTLALPPAYVETLHRYRGVREIMNRVHVTLRRGDKRQGGYDDEELRRTLEAARELAPGRHR